MTDTTNTATDVDTLLTAEDMNAALSSFVEKIGQAMEDERLDVSVIGLTSVLAALVEHAKDAPDYRKFLAAQILGSALKVTEDADMCLEEIITVVMNYDAARGAPVVAPDAPDAAFAAMAALSGTPATETEN